MDTTRSYERFQTPHCTRDNLRPISSLASSIKKRKQSTNYLESVLVVVEKVSPLMPLVEVTECAQSSLLKIFVEAMEANIVLATVAAFEWIAAA